MQLEKLEQSVADLQNSEQSLRDFMRGLVVRMSEEPLRNPGMIRAILLGYLSSSSVREAMIAKQDRAHQLHKKVVEIGQSRGEIRTDLPAAEIAHAFRQTILGTLLIWSVSGDASLRDRIDSALQLLWTGIAPKDSQNLSEKHSAPESSEEK